MKFERFEDILVWQKSKQLALVVYRCFTNTRDFNFKDQILSAAVSIMNNIAEGFERKGDKEFKHFLYISKGSCGELRSMLYLALELKYISQKDFQKIYDLSLEISRMLSGLIKTL